jgi:hypothetical protein
MFYIGWGWWLPPPLGCWFLAPRLGFPGGFLYRQHPPQQLQQPRPQDSTEHQQRRPPGPRRRPGTARRPGLRSARHTAARRPAARRRAPTARHPAAADQAPSRPSPGQPTRPSCRPARPHRGARSPPPAQLGPDHGAAPRANPPAGAAAPPGAVRPPRRPAASAGHPGRSRSRAAAPPGAAAGRCWFGSRQNGATPRKPSAAPPAQPVQILQPMDRARL